MEKHEVIVVGLGYIGLPTSLIIAKSGNRVTGFDLNKEHVAMLQRGEVTFEEKGLPELFKQAKQNIDFTNLLPVGDFYIICVPTPYDKESKKIDPSFVVSAFKEVYEVCPEDAIIVLESTVSPGTIDKYIRPLVGKKRINLAHCPERIIPGNMVYELSHNSRTIGADNPEIARRIADLYSSFSQGEIVLTDIRTAEMTKVVENTFRDINIAYANELVKICEAAGLDPYEVISIANHHPRVNILQPGPGVGGHCISVDPWFLVGDFPELTPLIRAARFENDSMPAYVLDKVLALAKEKGIPFQRIGLYGLTYKQNVDDIRESPTLQLLDILKERDLPQLNTFDPMISKKAVPSQIMDFEEFLDDCDLIVIMQNHNHLDEHQEAFAHKIVFDTKNCLRGENVFHY